MSDESIRIHWFPGHMNKTLREISDMQKKVDFVLYVLDSRAPFSCLNPELGKIVENKPICYCLTKKDLANSVETKKWLAHFSGKNSCAVAVDATKNTCVNEIVKEIEKLLSDKLARDKNKGIRKIYRGMVVGIPNSGKSTLINTLGGSTKAKTGDKAGVTKSTQWVQMGDYYELLDTPGTLWPKLENQKTALHLAYIGSVKDEVVDQGDLALELVKTLTEIAPKLLKERYGLETLDKEPIEIFDDICVSRGFLLRRGEMDYDRCAKAIIDDFRKCRIGKITLDLCDKIYK